MTENEVLRHAADEPMELLRRRFNRGESVELATPEHISAKQALEDVDYLQYVLEQAYSGYPYYDAALFDEGFSAMREKLGQWDESVPVRRLIDLAAEHLSFLEDGHLCLTAAGYGRGFYQKLQTYVTHLRVVRRGEGYVEASTGAPVCFFGEVRLFPTVTQAGQGCFLVGQRSKTPPKALELTVGGRREQMPLHPIQSKAPGTETKLREHYAGDLAVITCPSFVGDSAEELAQYFAVGEKCRTYPHVIWDLSNNTGGNAELPKQFLRGLNGGFIDENTVLELRSTLVCAKETGDIQPVAYHLQPVQSAREQPENLFGGTLWLIINDRVASSAENAITFAKSLPNVVVCGCSSMGIGRFGDLSVYHLPHSRVTLWCPQKVFESDIKETVGCEPELWLDTADPVTAVKTYLHSRA